MKKTIIITIALLAALLVFVSCEDSVDGVLNSVKEVILNKESLTIGAGKTETLTVTALPDYAPDKSITWSSSDESVATVNKDGKVTAVSGGTAEITATANSGGKTATCSVTVVDPLTLVFTENGSITFANRPSSLKYSKNGGELTPVSAEGITGVKDDVIRLYATRTTQGATNTFKIRCSSDCYVYGNVMSLIDEEGFETNTEVFTRAFRELFFDNSHIKNHPDKKIELPATTLGEECYEYMFHNCKGLTEAPELPADEMGKKSYYGMFYGCTGLTEAPALPATTLAEACYDHMFYGCTGLKETPELPATTLTKACYRCMFSDCTGLEKVTELPATTLAESSCAYMFDKCSSLTDVPDLQAETLAVSCCAYMFNKCSSLESAPALPATTLAKSCYDHMFADCTSLTAAPDLLAMTLAANCYQSMFNGCSNLEKAPVLPAAKLVDCCYWYMFFKCKKLNSITCLATDISADKCTTYWVAGGVSSLGVFTKAAGMTDWKTGDSGIPSGWIVIP